VIHLVMVVHSAISAGTFVVAKSVLVELSGLELALVRFTLAASIYAVLLWKQGVRVARRDLVALMVLGVIAIPLNQGLFLVGLARTTAGHAALLYALAPVFVFLIARARCRERATPSKIVGIALAFLGVLVVLVPRGAAAASGACPWIGDLVVLAAVAAYAVFASEGKPLAERYGPLTSTGLITVAGAVAYLPLGIVASDFHHIAALSRAGWLDIAYLVVAASVASYLLYYWVLARVDASRVAIWSNLQPVLTALLAWVIQGEPLAPTFVAGGAMVLAGVLLTQQAGSGAPAPRGRGA
jgi:drug/metabolite transporter (DMT)-like permease